MNPIYHLLAAIAVGLIALGRIGHLNDSLVRHKLAKARFRHNAHGQSADEYAKSCTRVVFQILIFVAALTVSLLNAYRYYVPL